MLTVPTYATVVTGSQSDVNLDLKYPLVYIQIMLMLKELLIQILQIMYSKQRICITTNIFIKFLKTIRLPMRIVKLFQSY